MFEKLLVATDFSAASDKLIGCLGGMKRLGTKEVLLVHALGIRHLQYIQPMLEPALEPRLRSQMEALEKLGFSVSTLILPGLAAHEIVHAASDKGVGAIAMATRKTTLFHDALLGGTVSHVVHESQVPVLVLQTRHEDEDKEWAERCREKCSTIAAHILYATDFSDTAERAFWLVHDLASSGADIITLLHVQDSSRIGLEGEALKEYNRIDHARLQRLIDELDGKGAAYIELVIRYGNPATEILRVAEEQGATLLVMGSHGRGFVPEVFLGSVSHQVVRHAPVPVLLVPPVPEGVSTDVVMSKHVATP